MAVPALIIHGGAGSITREYLSPEAWAQYSASLLRIYRSTAALLEKGAPALDAATHAVTLFEDCPLFNCGKGAVFTRDGTIEMESSVMVTNQYQKRYCATALLTRVKNPIKLAREMLIRGGCDTSGDARDAPNGAQGHCCLSGREAEKLAEEWGLELEDPKYFWTRKRWEEHRKGLGKPTMRSERGDMSAYPGQDGGEGWDGTEYLPQGTVGCVALDRNGSICTATSTGGLTNKLAGRIGDTPTSGAGFWAEQWPYQPSPPSNSRFAAFFDGAVSTFQSAFPADCLPYPGPSHKYRRLDEKEPTTQLRAIAVSGTGNGDSFLRLAACRTVGAIVRFSPPPPDGLAPVRTLASALNQIVGPGGELQRSAGNRWAKTGEGQGGMIGIEYVDDGKGGAKGEVVFDFNCGGMFRCWVDAQGKERVMVFRDEY